MVADGSRSFGYPRSFPKYYLDAKLPSAGPPTEAFGNALAIADGIPLPVTTIVTFAPVTKSAPDESASRVETFFSHIDWSIVFLLGVIVVVISASFGVYSAITSEIRGIGFYFIQRWKDRLSKRDPRSKWEKIQEELASALDLKSRQEIIFRWTLAEAVENHRRYSREYLSMAMAAWLFSVSQYVLGGLIAASPFFGPKWLTTFFGFLVLVTTLIRRIYNPGPAATAAKARARRYSALLDETMESMAQVSIDKDAGFHARATKHLRTRMRQIGESVILPEQPMDDKIIHPGESIPHSANSLGKGRDGDLIAHSEQQARDQGLPHQTTPPSL